MGWMGAWDRWGTPGSAFWRRKPVYHAKLQPAPRHQTLTKTLKTLFPNGPW
jgi:hypothetical protein